MHRHIRPLLVKNSRESTDGKTRDGDSENQMRLQNPTLRRSSDAHVAKGGLYWHESHVIEMRKGLKIGLKELSV